MLLLIYLLFGVFSIGILSLEYLIDTSSSYFLVSAFIILLALFVFTAWFAKTKSLFDIFSLFFLSAFLFNAAHAIPHLFMLDITDTWIYRYYNDSFATVAFVIVFISLYFVGLGGLLAASKKQQSSSPSLSPVFNLDSYRKVGWLLFVLSVVPIIVTTLKSLSIAYSQGYFALYQQEQLSPIMSLMVAVSKLFLPAILCLLIAYKEKPFYIRNILVSMLFYCGILFFIGYRGQATLTLLSIAWAYNAWIKPIPKLVLLSSAGVLGGIIFPLVALVRMTPGESRSNTGDFFTSFFSVNNPAIEILKEMGGSVVAIAGTYELIPSTQGFAYGASYVKAFLLGILPARLVGGEVLGDWLTWQLEPKFAADGGGLGFSFVAESYYNFGWVGIIFMSLITGLCLGHLALLGLRQKTPHVVFSLALLLTSIPYFARAETSQIFPALIRYLAFPMLLIWLSGKLTRAARTE